MRFGVLVLVAGALSLSACAKSEKDAGVENGACTQETLNAYNNVTHYGFLKSDGDNDTTASCKKVQSLLNGRSCKAVSTKTSEEISISYATVQDICEPLINKGTKSSDPYTPMPAPRSSQKSKYVQSNGRCTTTFENDREEVRRDLNKALNLRNSAYAYTAQAKCVIMDVEFRDQTCQSYDRKKQEFVSNSANAGELGQLCKGAQRLIERFENNRQR